jgi:hypothetical protein
LLGSTKAPKGKHVEKFFAAGQNSLLNTPPLDVIAILNSGYLPDFHSLFRFALPGSFKSKVTA